VIAGPSLHLCSPPSFGRRGGLFLDRLGRAVHLGGTRCAGTEPLSFFISCCSAAVIFIQQSKRPYRTKPLAVHGGHPCMGLPLASGTTQLKCHSGIRWCSALFDHRRISIAGGFPVRPINDNKVGNVGGQWPLIFLQQRHHNLARGDVCSYKNGSFAWRRASRGSLSIARRVLDEPAQSSESLANRSGSPVPG